MKYDLKNSDLKNFRSIRLLILPSSRVPEALKRMRYYNMLNIIGKRE